MQTHESSISLSLMMMLAKNNSNLSEIKLFKTSMDNFINVITWDYSLNHFYFCSWVIASNTTLPLANGEINFDLKGFSLDYFSSSSELLIFHSNTTIVYLKLNQERTLLFPINIIQSVNNSQDLFTPAII